MPWERLQSSVDCYLVSSPHMCSFARWHGHERGGVFRRVVLVNDSSRLPIVPTYYMHESLCWVSSALLTGSVVKLSVKSPSQQLYWTDLYEETLVIWGFAASNEPRWFSATDEGPDLRVGNRTGRVRLMDMWCQSQAQENKKICPRRGQLRSLG